MSVVLWPRQEVLQLVIPQLGSVGRHLNPNTANNLIRRLTKLQTPEGKISFDRWLVVAKEVLRWNDHCIHLFWDMVSLSTYYLSRDSSLSVHRQDVSLDMEYVAIFLALHVQDTTSPSMNHPQTPQSKATSSPTLAYEAVWPSAPGAATTPTAGTIPDEPGSPQTSPSKDHNRVHRKSPLSGSPMSPRSPKASQSPANKRSMAVSPQAKTPRSNAQHLHSVKQKIPLILRSLSIEHQDDTMLTDLTMSIDTPPHGNQAAEAQYSEVSQSSDFSISKKTLDALGLIICGGFSRDQAVPTLSQLYPTFHTTGEHDSGKECDDSTTVPFSELSGWINGHMSMNDLLYPVSVSPSYGAIPCSPTSRDMAHISAMNAIDADANKEGQNNLASKQQQPCRTINPVSSLSRAKPTIINGCSTTVVHIIGGTMMSAKNSFRRMRSMSMDKSDGGHSAHDLKHSLRNEHSDSDSDKTSPLGHTRPRNLSTQSNDFNYYFDDHGMMSDDSSRAAEDIEGLMRNNTSYLSRPELMLPPLFLNLCTKAKLYLVSPYHSASITGCSDCEIVIGAVFGAVIVSGCERVKITCACRKLVIVNSLDCAFNVATLTTTIIVGDCRGMVVGPYNTSYKNLRNHLKLAALEPLLSCEEPSANPIMPAALSAAAASVDNEHTQGYKPTSTGKNPNCWASLCDVSACLDAPPSSGSPEGYAVDALDDSCPLLPPLPSKARLLPYENFRETTIPFKGESSAFDQCAIRTPAQYLDSLREYHDSLEHIKAQVSSVITTPSPPGSGSVPPAPTAAATATAGANLSPEERKRKQLQAGAAVSKKFMEWLVASGNAKQVMDLIRIDNERAGLSGLQSGLQS